MGSEPFSGSILELIIFLSVLFSIWLIIREIVCWYYKINERIALQKRTNELLEQLLNKLSVPAPNSPHIPAKPNSLESVKISKDNLKIFTDEKKEHGLMCSERDLSNGSAWPAAKDMCLNYTEGGHDDWRLPTKEELALIYEQFYLNGVGDFKSGTYWSSVEFGVYDAWQQNFSNGKQAPGGKSTLSLVRAVRSF